MVTTPASQGLWLRWAGRDLRHHWVGVGAIAAVMAIGIGVYAGLGSTGTWRRDSNDASFERLAMHDLRATLSPGTFASEGALRSVVEQTLGSAEIVAVEERLVVDSQIDAGTAAEPILSAARLVGMDDLSSAGVDSLWIRDGALAAPGSSEGILELKYADHWELPSRGSVEVAGGHEVVYSGLGVSPEDFYYEGPEGTLLAEGQLAPLYLPLDLVQSIVGQPGAVNDIVIRLADPEDASSSLGPVSTGLSAAGLGATVATGDDAYAVRVLYDDIENDQRFWNATAALVLGGAALAAFNLIDRIVEAQRREIGIGMALGVSRSRLAIRPMLVGVEIAVLGAVLGVGVGLLVGSAMESVLRSFLPLPDYRTAFQAGVFARAAIIGVVVPILASAIPVWRAVRVEPIKAIRTGHLVAQSSRLTEWTARIQIPGSSLTQMSVRNVLRTPRRTLLTAVGVGAAITTLVAVLGLLDSIGKTVDEMGAEFSGSNADRVLVQLETFTPAEGPVVASIRSASSVSAADTGIRLPVVADPEGTDLDLLLELLDFDQATWTPTITDGGIDRSQPALVLAQKAADDLGVQVGDTVTLSHPRREGVGVAIVETEMLVAAIHANPIRTFAYQDLSESDVFGLSGLVNVVNAYPTADATAQEVQTELFGLDGVASSQAVVRIGESFDEALDQFVGILAIAAVAVLILALLIAFNATRITVEERRREHATMRAFGLPVRSVVAVVVKESVVIGGLATVIGLTAGFLVLGWMLESLASTSVPELLIPASLSPTTVGLAALIGILSVGVAPLFLVRRIARMSIPDTLRVME